MLKKSFFYFAILTLFLASCSSSDTKEGKYDTFAIESLDKMSETIGELNSCSYTLNTNVQKPNESNELSNFQSEHDVYMRGPDKFYIHTEGSKGKKSFWYNGSRFSYYSFNKNTFDTLSVEGNILEAIDFLHHKFGIYFPAADFFYPTLTDDLMENYPEIISLENTEGKDYIIIEALNSEKVIEIWIDANTYLPYKMKMSSIDDSGKSYQAVFSNWKVNPSLPDMLFEYEPSENTTREILPTKK